MPCSIMALHPMNAVSLKQNLCFQLLVFRHQNVAMYTGEAW